MAITRLGLGGFLSWAARLGVFSISPGISHASRRSNVWTYPPFLALSDIEPVPIQTCVSMRITHIIRIMRLAPLADYSVVTKQGTWKSKA